MQRYFPLVASHTRPAQACGTFGFLFAKANRATQFAILQHWNGQRRPILSHRTCSLLPVPCLNAPSHAMLPTSARAPPAIRSSAPSQPSICMRDPAFLYSTEWNPRVAEPVRCTPCAVPEAGRVRFQSSDGAEWCPRRSPSIYRSFSWILILRSDPCHGIASNRPNQSCSSCGYH